MTVILVSAEPRLWPASIDVVRPAIRAARVDQLGHQLESHRQRRYERAMEQRLKQSSEGLSSLARGLERDESAERTGGADTRLFEATRAKHFRKRDQFYQKAGRLSNILTLSLFEVDAEVQTQTPRDARLK